jgi:hypothetical protein
MALKKSKKIKGIQADYWKIVDCNVKTGFVGLALYYNQESAIERENMLEGRIAFQIDFPVDVTCPIGYAYNKIKESKKELNEEDKLVEKNWFFDAEDC